METEAQEQAQEHIELLTTQTDFNMSEGRRIKLTFKRKLPREHDLSIMFGVDEEKSADLFSEIKDLLNFVIAHDGIVEADDIVDIESGKQSDLNIVVRGNQELFVDEFRANRIPKFKALVKWAY